MSYAQVAPDADDVLFDASRTDTAPDAGLTFQGLLYVKRESTIATGLRFTFHPYDNHS